MHYICEYWHQFTHWLTSDPEWWSGFKANGFFFGLDILLLTIALPLWLRWLDQRHWRAMRQQLIDSALNADKMCRQRTSTVTRELLRPKGAITPLERLQHVSAAIEHQRADAENFYQKCSIYSTAVDGSIADMLTGTIAFCDTTRQVLPVLTRLYLREAKIGTATLGFDKKQPVSRTFLTQIGQLADDFENSGIHSCYLIERALIKRGLKKRIPELDLATRPAAELAGFIRTFAAEYLQDYDPHSTQYRASRAGDHMPRDLDSMIAHFDRA